MDLAVRAGLKGWKFLYLGDLQVKLEFDDLKSVTLVRSDVHVYLIIDLVVVGVGKK